MATLYELTDEWQEVLEMAEDGDVPQEDIESRLDRIAGDIKSKADGYCSVIAQLNADAEMFRNEEARLKRRRQAAENNAKRLKDGLLAAMQAVGTDKIKTGVFAVTVRKNPEKLEVADMDAFMAWAEQNAPDLIKVTKSVNNTAVRQALKDGVEVPGAEMVATTGIAIR